jgi:hypothetical protein
MPFVSITRLRVRSWRYLPLFLLQSVRAARQAKGAPGNLSVSLLRDAEFAFWTRTVWNDETAMRGFMLSGTHRRVMPRLLQWCDEAAVAHWVQESSEPPSGRRRTGACSRMGGLPRSTIPRRRNSSSRFPRRAAAAGC